MSDDSAQPKPLFAVPQPSAAGVPHLLTYFDTDLLHAVVRINGAKLGVWNVAAPYDENDRYEPYRENAPLSAWAMALNQQALLNLDANISGLIFDNETMLVDSTVDEAALKACIVAGAEQGYENLPDFPGLLRTINWALIPVGPEHDHGLFLATEAKQDYVELLLHWCHQRGRTVSTIGIADGKYVLRHHPAPDEARRQAAVEHGFQYLTRMGHFGISAQEALQHLTQAVNGLPKS